MKKVTLNIGLKTYLGTELRLDQVLDAVRACWDSVNDSSGLAIRIRVAEGTYNGEPEPTAIVQIAYKHFNYWWNRFAQDLCKVLAQESVSLVTTGLNDLPHGMIHYHPNYREICLMQGKNHLHKQDFNPDLFLHYNRSENEKASH